MTHKSLVESTCNGHLQRFGSKFQEDMDWTLYECQTCKKVIWEGLDTAEERHQTKQETLNSNHKGEDYEQDSNI
jgi:hypothetical protein